jgi:predicted PhzF superfamily epimerase YddE/YHI9
MSSIASFRYRVVDVFTSCSLAGNQLAVFPDASGIDSAIMPRIARELNLAETTVVLLVMGDSDNCTGLKLPGLILYMSCARVP